MDACLSNLFCMHPFSTSIWTTRVLCSFRVQREFYKMTLTGRLGFQQTTLGSQSKIPGPKILVQRKQVVSEIFSGYQLAPNLMKIFHGSHATEDGLVEVKRNLMKYLLKALQFKMKYNTRIGVYTYAYSYCIICFGLHIYAFHSIFGMEKEFLAIQLVWCS